jgi:hypothetical protein
LDVAITGALVKLEYDPQPLFKAGSENNTEKYLVEMMRTMYDLGINPLKDSLLRK